MGLDETVLEEQGLELGICRQPGHLMSRRHQGSLSPRSLSVPRGLAKTLPDMLGDAASQIVRFSDVQDVAVPIAEQVHSRASGEERSLSDGHLSHVAGRIPVPMEGTASST